MRTIHRTIRTCYGYFLIIAALVLLPRISAASESAVFSNGLAKADADRIVEDCLKILQRGDPGPFIYPVLNTFNEWSDYCRKKHNAEQVFIHSLERTDLHPLAAIAIRDKVEHLVEHNHKAVRDAGITIGTGCAPVWHWCGPLDKGIAFDLYKQMKPETDCALSTEYRNNCGRTRSWNTFLPSPASMKISAHRFYNGPRAAFYYQAAFENTTPRKLIMRFACAGSFRLMLNHTEVLTAERSAAVYPHEFYRMINAPRGRIHFLIKTDSSTSFTLRFYTPDGTPAKLDWMKKPTPGKPNNISLNEHFTTERKTPTKKTTASLILHAMALMDMGLSSQAVRLMKTAAADTDRSAAQSYYLSRLYQKASYLPSETVTSLSDQYIEDALSKDPDFLPAVLEKIRRLTEDSKEEKAMKMLLALQKDNADNLPLVFLFEIHHIAKSMGWTWESEQALKKILRVLPATPFRLRMQKNRYRANSMTSQWLENLKQILTVQDNPGEIAELCRYESQYLGKHTQALKRIESARKQWPQSIFLLNTQAAILKTMGKHRDAVRLIRQFVNTHPMKASLIKSCAILNLRTGNTKDARKNLETLVRLRPQKSVYRALSSLGGDQTESAFTVQAEKIIRQTPGPEDYPDSSSLLVLDQCDLVLRTDGSGDNIVHQIYKVLNPEGVRELDSVTVNGEAEIIRTIRDGETVEPVHLNRNNYHMPRLDVGAFVEMKYNTYFPARYSSYKNYMTFYFQDPYFKNPFVISRFRLVVPEQLNLNIKYRNLQKKPLIRRQNNKTEYIFEAHNIERPKTEPYMPPKWEFLPCVEIFHPQSWDEINNAVRNSLNWGTLVTEEIREECAKIITPAMSVAEKARALYTHSLRILKDTTHSDSAVETLVSRRGSWKNLFIALLKAADIPFDACKARNPSQAFGDPRWDMVSRRYFTRSLLRIHTDDDPLWVNLGVRDCPFGWIPPRLYGAPVYISGRQKGALSKLPSGDTRNRAPVHTRTRMTLEQDGIVTGQITITFLTENYFRYKRDLGKYSKDKKELWAHRVLNQYVPAADIQKIAVNNLDILEKPIELVVNYTTNGLTEVTKKGINLKLNFDKPNLVKLFGGQADRKTRLHFPHWIVRHDTVEIKCAKKFTIQAPENANTTTDFGTFNLNFQTKDSVITITRDKTIHPFRLPPEQYPDFIDQCKEIDNAGKVQIKFLKKDKQKP